jgi:DUF1365 family protein
MHLFDLAELGRINKTSRLLGYNTPAPVGLHDADHFDGRPLREGIEHAVVSRGLTWPGGRVLLLTHCRVAGYVFNPVSFFYCFDPGGDLAIVVAEVNNTYGERHVYVLPGGGSADRLHKKEFHVSPFFGLEGTYRFRLGTPGESLSVGMDLTVGNDRLFTARLDLARQRLTDGALLGMLAAYPLVTARVVAAIHWQAVRLWWKGVPFRGKPVYAPASARQSQP